MKTSGMSSPDVSSHSSVSSLGKLLFAGEEDDDDDDFEEGVKTDQEVSKYSFYDRLEHYMERELIKGGKPQVGRACYHGGGGVECA
jgi:hypothetical protein